jgi:hypothetical protein
VTTTAPAVAEQPSPAYPVPRPDSGDDPRFCSGLGIDVGKVLAQYGYPPVSTGQDLGRVMQALFRLIYQENQP